ncbi:ECF transporter S component [Aquisalibacillus elongatus]|uniref:Energy-coupling factor transport system substrate-specific component n=1 Tax=Aquisalibacillus elongatus TaxID=485577 RepID=A0A3N5C9E5_9BACI|nr:ECF transporter S component [Aquisalibacillus elongatus]RPF53251.1 energy-coupling factor transport system substrate-specific component [Aquisalibacillus elongatus]
MNQWKLKEIVLMSILGVVFGFIYLGFFGVGKILTSIMAPLGLGDLGYEVIYGIWFIVSVIAAYIIRKPGAALMAEMIAALVEVLAGSTTGPSLLISGFIQGLGAELAFALTRWKDYRLRILIFSGVGAALLSFPYHFFTQGYDALEPWVVTLMFSARVISAILITGLLGKFISDQLAKTGALQGYALGKEMKQKKRDDHVA